VVPALGWAEELEGLADGIPEAVAENRLVMLLRSAILLSQKRHQLFNWRTWD